MTDNYYKFIKPQRLVPREPKLAIGPEAIDCIKWLITQEPEIVHYDLETTGLTYADPNKVVTTIGLSTPEWCIGIDLLDVDATTLGQLWNWLKKQRLAGFNLAFDLAWPWRVVQSDGRVKQNIDDLQVISDTLLWFRLLGTEAHSGQTYTLETLVDRVLGWPEHMFQKTWLKDSLTKHKLKRAEMYKLALLEPEGYTRYCALDAEASFQADQVFKDTLKKWGFEGLEKYNQGILIPKIKRTIHATSNGIPVDRSKLAQNIEMVQARLLILEAKALAHPQVKDYVEEYENNKLHKNHTLSWSLRKKWAKKSDEPWKYPEKYRLCLENNPKKLEKLPAWNRKYGGKFYEAETQFSIKGKNIEWPRFNVNSPADMQWLIYDKWLANKYRVWYRNPEKPNWGGLVTVTVDGEDYELKLTQAGGLPTGGDILTLFGDIGQILNEYKSLDKLLNDFLSKYYVASQRTEYVHAQSKILGTISGRASGGSSG